MHEINDLYTTYIGDFVFFQNKSIRRFYSKEMFLEVNNENKTKKVLPEEGDWISVNPYYYICAVVNIAKQNVYFSTLYQYCGRRLVAVVVSTAQKICVQSNTGGFFFL